MTTAYEFERITDYDFSGQVSFLLTLQEIHRILDLTLGFENAVMRVLNVLAERHQLQQSQLSLLDERSQEIRIIAAVGISGRARSMGRYQLGEGITGQVVKSGKTIIVPQVALEPMHLNRMGTANDTEDRAFVCVPIQSQGRTHGTLAAYLRVRQEEELNCVAAFLAVVATLLAHTISKPQQTNSSIPEEKFNSNKSVPHKADIGSFIGSSNAVLTVLEQSLQVAPAKTTVLFKKPFQTQLKPSQLAR